jgi:hypothetical protein
LLCFRFFARNTRDAHQLLSQIEKLAPQRIDACLDLGRGQALHSCILGKRISELKAPQKKVSAALSTGAGLCIRIAILSLGVFLSHQSNSKRKGGHGDTEEIRGINRKTHYDIFFTEEREEHEEHEGVKQTLCGLGDLFVRKGSDEGFFLVSLEVVLIL